MNRAFPVSKVRDYIDSAAIRIRRFGVIAAPPVLRIALALPFLRSGRTRLGWLPVDITDYRLPV